MIPPPPRSRPPCIPPKIAENWAIRASMDMAPAMVATTDIMRVSRLPTWAISWAITAPNSSRVSSRWIPVVAATVAFLGLRPVAKALGEALSIS